MITNKIVLTIISVTALIFIPIQLITTFVLGILVTLTFGLLLIPFNIIWLVLFYFPLIALSYIYDHISILKPFVAIIGIPLAVLGDTYVALIPSMGEMNSRYAKMVHCQTFPYTWRFFQYLRDKLDIEKHGILNQIFYAISTAGPLKKYLDDLRAMKFIEKERLKNKS